MDVDIAQLITAVYTQLLAAACQPKPPVNCKTTCVRMNIIVHTVVTHNTARNSADNLPLFVDGFALTTDMTYHYLSR